MAKNLGVEIWWDGWDGWDGWIQNQVKDIYFFVKGYVASFLCWLVGWPRWFRIAKQPPESGDWENLKLRDPKIQEANRFFPTLTLQGINISHLGKRKIIFTIPFWGDMLVPWRVWRKVLTTWSFVLTMPFFFLESFWPVLPSNFLDLTRACQVFFGSHIKSYPNPTIEHALIFPPFFFLFGILTKISVFEIEKHSNQFWISGFCWTFARMDHFCCQDVLFVCADRVGREPLSSFGRTDMHFLVGLWQFRRIYNQLQYL